jgi:hypothetical protein
MARPDPAPVTMRTVSRRRVAGTLDVLPQASSAASSGDRQEEHGSGE